MFALSRVQGLAQRVANAAVPDARPVVDLTREERLILYRERVRAAWADGMLTPRERSLLDETRERLSLEPAETSIIEREVVRDVEARATG